MFSRLRSICSRSCWVRNWLLRSSPCIGGWFCACLESCSRNCASACRSSCISFWISSSEAPCSSAFCRRSWAARSARSASVRLPSSMRSAMFHSWAMTLLRAGARAVALQAPIGRAQAQEHLQVVDELLRLQRQRGDGAGHLRPVARVLGQPAPLLDDGARQRLAEAPLGQHQLDRRAAPGLAGKVLGDERQLDLHARPGMVADLVEALPFGLLGIGARQPQRQRRRPLVRRARALLGAGPRPGGRGLVLLRPHALDAALGGDDAVVVLDLEEQLQRAARALLGVLGDGDLGRVVGDHLERPAQQLDAAGVDRDRARLAHLELELGHVRGIGGGRRLEALHGAVAAPHLQRQGADGGARAAHHQLAAVGYLEGRGRLLLRPGQAMRAVGQHDGRPAGVGRRRHPGIDARLRALGERAEAEGRAQPVGGAVADHDQQHEHAEQQQGAQREGVVAVGAGRGMADAQLLQQRGEALAVHAPQRLGAGIAGTQRQRILVGGGRPVLDAGHRLDAADGLVARGPAHPRQRHQGGGERQPEQAENDLVRQLRQPAATARPARRR